MHKFPLAQRQHFSPHDTGVALPTSQTEHQDNIADAWPQHCDHRKSQNELWESEHKVYQGHNASVHPPAQKSGEQAKGNPNQETNTHRRNANAQRDATAVNNTTENVSPNIVCTKEVGRTAALDPDRGFEARYQALLVGLVRRQGVSQQRATKDNEQNKPTDHPHWMMHKLPPAVPS